jgi:hypothetical protein
VLTGFGWRARWLKYLALVPLAAAVLHLAENITMRSLIAAGPRPIDYVVQRAEI